MNVTEKAQWVNVTLSGRLGKLYLNTVNLLFNCTKAEGFNLPHSRHQTCTVAAALSGQTPGKERKLLS